jgi:hypothetical protein
VSQGNLRESTRRTGQEFLIASCGFVTSLLTALILWWVEARFGFALYTWMVWFVIPVGAILAGFAGASGYYAGALYFGHRPTRLLLLNIVLASIATFFLIYYLSYVSLQIEGKQVRDYVSFPQYLDTAIRSTSLEFRLRVAKIGSTGELGAFGYVMAFLQVLGFAAGGFGIYGYLVSKPYCERCSRYFSGKGRQIRYAADSEGLQKTVAGILEQMRNNAAAQAIEQHRGSGTPTPQKGDQLRSLFEVQHCKQCGQHWVKFTVEKKTGDNWKEVRELTVAGYTDQAISV